MTVPTAITDLSATIASNSPAGSEAVFPDGDNYIRAAMAFIRQGDTKASDVASASSVDLGAVVGRIVDVTGTTTITSFGTVAAGFWRIVRFTGALTLTHNGTSLILPTGANITTAAGDCIIAVSLGSGNWLVTHYEPKRARFIAANSSGGLTFDTSQTVATFAIETADEGGNFASSTFTAPRAGMYAFGFSGNILVSSGTTEGELRIGFINAANAYTHNLYISRHYPYASGLFYVPVSFQTVLRLAAGDTVRVGFSKDASITDTVTLDGTRYFHGYLL